VKRCIIWKIGNNISKIAQFLTSKYINSLNCCDNRDRELVGTNQPNYTAPLLKFSSSSYIFHGVESLVVPFRSHVSRSLFKNLPWFLLPAGEKYFITLGNLFRSILFTCCIQLSLYSSNLSKICVIFNSFANCSNFSTHNYQNLRPRNNFLVNEQPDLGTLQWTFRFYREWGVSCIAKQPVASKENLTVYS